MIQSTLLPDNVLRSDVRPSATTTYLPGDSNATDQNAIESARRTLNDAIHDHDLKAAIAVIRSCRRAADANDVLMRAGFAISFEKTLSGVLANIQRQLVKSCHAGTVISR